MDAIAAAIWLLLWSWSRRWIYMARSLDRIVDRGITAAVPNFRRVTLGTGLLAPGPFHLSPRES
jgi:hypothetical protein